MVRSENSYTIFNREQPVVETRQREGGLCFQDSGQLWEVNVWGKPVEDKGLGKGLLCRSRQCCPLVSAAADVLFLAQAGHVITQVS